MTERDLDGLRAYARQVSAQANQLRQNLGELQRELRAVTATAKSPDGYVTATVGARGQLVKLHLDPRIYRRQDSQQLATTITETIQRAAAEAGEQIKAISQRYAPGTDVGSYLRGDLAQRIDRFNVIEEQIAGGMG